VSTPFLLEIGTEEIPDWTIEPALADLRSRFERLLTANKLAGEILWVDATPRRLALQAERVDERQPDTEEIVMGPPRAAGAPAAKGFAKKMGATVENLEVTATEKGDYYTFRKLVKGRSTIEVLSSDLPGVITGISFPKTMYWTGKGGVRFIRPIRWIVAVLGSDVVPFEVAGVSSADATRGHRILGSKDVIPITIGTYEQKLRENGVIIRAAERRTRIKDSLGEDVQPDTELLEALTYLTEFPTAIRGSFDASYLELPKEVLSTVMRHHQRYFSVVKPNRSLAAEFVAVTNTNGDPDGLIRHGNERVLRARFNDARFFWQVDQRKKLEARVEDLQKVTFQAKLPAPTYKDKTMRLKAMAAQLSRRLVLDAFALDRAAFLSKTDLTTEMVKEFTELQGVVGGLYAKAQGETDTVAAAIYDHYKPVSMEDSIPRTAEGQALSIADKLDTLIQSFNIGLIPSGSKDPFALRRAAQGVIKLLFEARLPLNLFEFIEEAGRGQSFKLGAQTELREFISERIAFYLRDGKGYPYDEVNAVMATPMTTLADLADRRDALHSIRQTANFEALAASFKRIKNILRQAQFSEPRSTNPALITNGPEDELHQAFLRVRKQVQGTSNYTAKLTNIAALRPQVDLFFDKILVNDPDPEIRKNRLALLQSLLTEFSNIADFAEIVTEGGSVQS
jgi:glycyl-tRNA synthetase beta chain